MSGCTLAGSVVAVVAENVGPWPLRNVAPGTVSYTCLCSRDGGPMRRIVGGLTAKEAGAWLRWCLADGAVLS